MSRQQYGAHKALAGIMKVDQADRSLRQAAKYLKAQSDAEDRATGALGTGGDTWHMYHVDCSCALAILAAAILSLPMPRSPEQVAGLKRFAEGPERGQKLRELEDRRYPPDNCSCGCAGDEETHYKYGSDGWPRRRFPRGLA